MTPDDFPEKRQEISQDLTRKGFQRPFLFACIAADGCTMTGSESAKSPYSWPSGGIGVAGICSARWIGRSEIADSDASIW
jgi:hypothetical protein